MREQIRLTDSAVRRGGDEFSMLLVDLPDAETATRSAERILARIREPVEIDKGPVSVGASIGVYFIAPSERPPTTGRLHDLSDQLMYEAKKRGGGLAFGPPDVFGPPAAIGIPGLDPASALTRAISGRRIPRP